ncbi:MAG TPA: diaminopimelate decarboxylase [Acidimicrobiales bacterium]|jgi:diaminopimelate decarboxylase
MPVDHEVASAPIQWSLLPRTATTNAQGHLEVGGLDLLTLAEEFGTPLFVYDEQHIRAACREAVAAWGDGVAYATKAFLCRAMAQLAHEEGMHLDVASGGELHVALAAGVPAAHLVLHGNNKSVEELSTAVSVGVGRIVIDSFEEIARLGRILESAPAMPQRPKVLVRVTPGVEAHTHEFVRTGQEDSKFGFSVSSGAAAEAVAALELMPGVELAGVHAHIGSQVFDASSFEQAVEVLGAFFAPLDLPELVVGGGLGVPYVNGEHAPTITEWAEATRVACAKAGLDPATRVSAEPGRSIVAAAAITLYRVGTVKQLPGIRTYVSVDGGMSDNPRPVLYGSGYEAFLARSPLAPRPRPVRVVGKHCESGDLIVPEAFVPEDLVVGDILATPVTGAYGYSMASNYNKVPRPAVLFVADGRARVVVRRETFDDLLQLDA